AQARRPGGKGALAESTTRRKRTLAQSAACYERALTTGPARHGRALATRPACREGASQAASTWPAPGRPRHRRPRRHELPRAACPARKQQTEPYVVALCSPV